MKSLEVAGGRWAAVVALAAALAAPAPGAEVDEPARRAVVVGISDYSAEGLPEPAERWAARKLYPSLKGARNDAVAMTEILQSVYGFAPEGIVTLLDRQATRAAILASIETQLVAPARPGDELVFFFAGHGSRVVNVASDEPDGLDETLVPADSAVGALDIHDKELRAAFNRVLDRGARLTVILDACYSGSATRGVQRIRALASPPGSRTVSGPYGPRIENRGALVLAAAQDEQRAGEAMDWERQMPRGSFTLALQRAIRLSRPGESAQHLFQRARAILQTLGVDQEPVLAAQPEMRHRAFLGGRIDRERDRIVIAVERIAADGSAVLQGGWATGLTVGSELRPVSDDDRPRGNWRVVALDGLGESRAVPVDRGRAAKLREGDLLELERWAGQASARLRLWVPATILGDLDRYLFPESPRNFERASDPEAADYHLASRRVADRTEFAWVHRSIEGDATGMPERSAWVPLESDLASTGRDLERAAARLGRVAAWLRLESPPRADYPYRLVLTSVDEPSRDLVSGTLVEGTEHGLALVLKADSNPTGGTHRRYVYVFSIDSNGRSVLLFPYPANVENRLPLSGAPPRIVLANPSFRVGEPYGSETFVLIASQEPLPNLLDLEFEGVRAPLSGASTVVRLLIQSLTGHHGEPEPSASLWTIERLFFSSRPRT